MRRLMLVHLVCGLGLAVTRPCGRRRPASHPPRNRPPPHPPPRRRRPVSRPQPRPRHRPPRRSPRSLFDEEPRQFQIGGRLSSVSAIRRASSAIRISGTACSSPARYTREGTDGAGCSPGPRTTSAGAISASSARYERPGKLLDHGLVGSDPAVLQRRHADAVHDARQPARARRRDAAGDPERAGDARPLTYVPLATQFDLRERRDIGTFDIKLASDEAARRDGGVHDAEALRRAALGRQLRLQQRRRGGAALRSRTNDFTLGAEWNNSRNMLRVAYAGSWFNNQDDTLVWDSPLRLDRLGEQPRTRADGALADQLRPDRQRRRLHEARAPDAAHGLRLVRRLEQRQPLLPFTINTRRSRHWPCRETRADADGAASCRRT